MSDSYNKHSHNDKDDLREFVTKLYLECIMRFQNVSIERNETISDEVTPRYIENAIYHEDSNGLMHVDEVLAERETFFATMATETIPEDEVGNVGLVVKNASISLTNTIAEYCPLRFDGYLCWPQAPAGTVLSQNCPHFVEGFNSKFLAYKACLKNGSWYRHPMTGQEWSNYTNCIDYVDLEFRSFVNDLYVTGYSVSLVALVLSLIIFLGFKSLRCTRIRIHVHLFASLALTCLCWILWYKLVIAEPENINQSPLWCIGLHLMLNYSMLVNYFWMFCEGLHLHMVLVVVFIKDTVVMRWFKAFTWLSPILLLMAYSTLRIHLEKSTVNCWMDDSLTLWIFSVPICVSLFASFVFLVNVLRVIVRKLHPQSDHPAPLAIRKAVRATIILVPLFGLQHFLLPYRPDSGTPLERFYQILSAILVSLQGLVVSFIFCFANQDVVYALQAISNRMFPTLIAPPPKGTNTIQLATLTPSRELGA